MKALITAQLTDDGIELLGKYMELKFGGWGTTGVKLEEDELIKEAADCDFLIVCYEQVTKKVMESLPLLRAVACARGGVRASVDLDAAKELNIPVIYTPGRNAAAVADVTIGLMLSAARKIAYTNHLIFSGKWEEVPWDINGNTTVKRFSGPELEGKTLGLVGLGHVGWEVVRRAWGFGMKIIAFDPMFKKGPYDIPVESVSLDEVMSKSDFVAIACPLNKATTGLVDASKIALMKPTAFFINSARGAIVDENALAEALANKKIAGAGIDVLIDEPIRRDHPFLKLNNITITPHVGGASDDIVSRQTMMIAKDIVRMLEGEKPINVAGSEAH